MRSAIGVALCLLVLPAGVGAQSREFSRTVELAPGGTLRLHGTKGSMRIESWAEPRVEVRARIERPENVDEEYAARAVEATVIKVVSNGNAAAVMTDYENVPTREGGGGWGDRTVPPVHYEIRAPRSLDLRVDSDRGPVSIAGFDGTLDVVIDRGELELRDVAGELRVNIDRGERSRFSGVRGRLQLEADRTDLDIDADAIESNSRIDIDRGDVEVRLPEAQRLTVRTDISRRGRFNTDFPIEWSSSDPRRSEGRINGGGAELFVESDRATIDLRRKRD